MTDPRKFSRGRPASGGWRLSVVEVMGALGAFEAIQIADSLGEPRLAEDLERAARNGNLGQARELVVAVNSLLEESFAEAAAFQRRVAGDFPGNDYIDWDSDYNDWGWDALLEWGDGRWAEKRWTDDRWTADEPEPDYVVRFRQPFRASGYEARTRSYRDDGQHGRNHRADGRDRAIRRYRRVIKQGDGNRWFNPGLAEEPEWDSEEEANLRQVLRAWEDSYPEDWEWNEEDDGWE